MSKTLVFFGIFWKPPSACLPCLTRRLGGCFLLHLQSSETWLFCWKMHSKYQIFGFFWGRTRNSTLKGDSVYAVSEQPTTTAVALCADANSLPHVATTMTKLVSHYFWNRQTDRHLPLNLRLFRLFLCYYFDLYLPTSLKIGVPSLRCGRLRRSPWTQHWNTPIWRLNPK